MAEGEGQIKENGHGLFDTYDPHYEPIITLPPKVECKTLEEDEDVLFKMRAKLFRFDQDLDPPEWKERGVGDVTLLQNKYSHLIRVLMRREKVFKLCANHLVLPEMKLTPNCGSDRAWIWNTLSDYSEEEPRPEMLAIRFANSENAQKFKENFDNARHTMKEVLGKQSLRHTEGEDKSSDEDNDDEEEEEQSDNEEKESNKEGNESSDKVAEDLNAMSLKDSTDTPTQSETESKVNQSDCIKQSPDATTPIEKNDQEDV